MVYYLAVFLDKYMTVQFKEISEPKLKDIKITRHQNIAQKIQQKKRCKH